MRRFGVEIEAGLQGGSSIHDVSRALAAAGLGGRVASYSQHDTHGWVVKLDGSVSGGVEVVSPPLDFDDEAQRGQVDRAVAAIQPHCRTHASAGIHVHVEAADLSAEQIGNVARTFAHFEDVIYRLASSGWTTLRPGARTYCKPLTADQVAGLARAKTADAVRLAYYGRGRGVTAGHGDASRYCGINLHSYFYRGTIEFRVFNSSMNAMRIQTYIAMCVAMVQDGRNGKKRSVAKRYVLGGMAAGTTDGAKAFFSFLAMFRYDAGASLADYRNIKKVWKDSKAQQPIASSPYGW